MSYLPDDVLRYGVYPFLEKEDIEATEEATGVSASWLAVLSMKDKEAYREISNCRYRQKLHILTISLDTADGYVIENLLSNLNPKRILKWVRNFLFRYSHTAVNTRQIAIFIQNALDNGEATLGVRSIEDYEGSLILTIGSRLEETFDDIFFS